MGLFDFLKSEIEDPHELFKKATKKANENNYEEAIEYCREAFNKINIDNKYYHTLISYYLKIPGYLRKIGEYDKSWGEYNALLLRQSQHTDITPMYHNEIYKAMSYQLRIEKKYNLSIRFAIMSQFSWMWGLFIQKRNKELEDNISREYVYKKNKMLLKKAKKEHLFDNIYAEIKNFVDEFPKNKLGEISRRIDLILLENDPKNKGGKK